MSSHLPTPVSFSESQVGTAYALMTYGSWGVLTLYWKWVDWLPSEQVIAHRVIWSLLFLLLLLAQRRQLGGLLRVFRQPRLLLTLLFTGALISCNWLLFVWAVAHGHVVQASLGYFINPLFSVLLGVFVLREKLSAARWAAVLLAALGVLWQVWTLGAWPWVSLGLAASFAVYGLIRKFAPVSGTVGLAVETLMLLPVAAAFLLWVAGRPELVTWTARGAGGILSIVLTGVVTALPLLWFANAARRLPLSTMGFFQYLAPSIQLAIGVWLLHEPFGRQHLISFGLIWLAILVFSLDSLAHRRRAA